MLAIDPNDCYLVIDSVFAVAVFAALIKALVFLIVLLLAVSVHEGAHAAVSYLFGDNTAYLLGRVSLNPRKHAEPIGTLLLPIAGFVSGSAIVGWGKPTPVNESKWTNYRLGKFSVSVAGVLANLIVVALGIVLAKFLMRYGVGEEPFRDFFKTPALNLETTKAGLLRLAALFTSYSILVNYSLFLFNLLPIPPLDGGNILASFLPDSFKPIFEFLGRFGFIVILVVIIVLSLSGFKVGPLYNPLTYLVVTDIFR